MGSSPHARGLRDLTLLHGVAEGIIPARAGFTPAGAGRRPRGSDHPRTRGVYTPPSGPSPASTGSSPHARGLRVAGRPQPPHVGIIPARAGFTHDPLLVPTGSKDHPRTRGVYKPVMLRYSRGFGSSPHARGLLPPSSEIVIAARIIPARAGFTTNCSQWKASGEDHPRTRGVYTT